MTKDFAFAAAARLPAVLALGALALAGCGPAKTDGDQKPAPAAQSKPAPAAIPQADADLLAPLAVAKATGPMSDEDKAWEEMLKLLQGPAVPEAWQFTPPTQEEMAAFEKKAGEHAVQAAEKAKDFYTRFPKHERAGDARKAEHQLLNMAVQTGQTNQLAQLEKIEEALLKDPKLDEDERFELRTAQLQRRLEAREGESESVKLAELEKVARSLQKEFPRREEVASMLVEVAQGWLDAGDTDKARALAGELAKSEAAPDVKQAAQSLLKRADRVGQPLALAFKSVDGREVDLAKLKGKVVLIDFWATWCIPCMAELPKLKAAFEKLNPRGFEIVGISLDDDRSALERVVAREKMPWPQYFDKADDSKKFSEQFEIESIPTVWLVDRKGNLRDLNARENLVEKVEKLLAEREQ